MGFFITLESSVKKNILTDKSLDPLTFKITKAVYPSKGLY